MLHLTWLKEAQDVYLDIGCGVSADGVELSIAQGLEEKPEMLEYTRKLYNENEYVTESGEDSSAAIFAGNQLYDALLEKEKVIEQAERLLMKLVKHSRITYSRARP